LLGPEGLQRAAAASHGNTAALVNAVSGIEGVEVMFSTPAFHEVVLRLPKKAGEVLAAMAKNNVLGGYDLSREYPEMGEAILVCATETKTPEDIEHYAASLREALS